MCAMNAAAPDGAPPQRIMNEKNLKKLPRPAVPRRGPDAGNPRIFDHFTIRLKRSEDFQVSNTRYTSAIRHSPCDFPREITKKFPKKMSFTKKDSSSWPVLFGYPMDF